jgi:hypothetical protein
MIPWFHFGGGKNLLFKSLHLSSQGAITGTCIVLVVIALFERWVAAMRATLENHWRKRSTAAAYICACSSSKFQQAYLQPNIPQLTQPQSYGWVKMQKMPNTYFSCLQFHDWRVFNSRSCKFIVIRWGYFWKCIVLSGDRPVAGKNLWLAALAVHYNVQDATDGNGSSATADTSSYAVWSENNHTNTI